MRKIGVVILNYNTYEITTNAIKEVCRQDCIDQLLIIIVDNASKNESSQILKKVAHENNCVFIQNESNLGYAAGNNVGIRYAISQGCEYVLVMNNDVEFPEAYTISVLMSQLENNQTIGAVSPKIVGSDRKDDKPIYYKKPTLWELSFGMVRFAKGREDFDVELNQRVYAVRGNCMLLRIKAIEVDEPFDEYTFLYYEEPILAEKLAVAGYECWHCGETYVIHNHAQTIKSSMQKKSMINTLCRSYDYYMKKYRNFSWISRKMCICFRRLVASRR